MKGIPWRAIGDAPAEVILTQIMEAIEQGKDHMMKGAHHWKTVEEKAA